MLGTTLDHRFRLEQRLALAPSGGLFLATDERSGEMLAVKIFASPPSPESEEWLRYARLMERLRGLDHPHLITPLETRHLGGRAFQVLPYYPAQSLAEALRERPFTAAETAELLRQAAAGLQALHAAGVPHLGLTAANVMLTRGDAGDGTLHLALTDPARSLLRSLYSPSGDDAPHGLGGHPAPRQAGPRQALGAPDSPGQGSHFDFDEGAPGDLYALGLLAREALRSAAQGDPAGRNGRPETEAGSTGGVAAHSQPQVPGRLAAIISRLTEPLPERRYRSAAGLTADLELWTLDHPGGLGERDAPRLALSTMLAPQRGSIIGRDAVQEALRAALGSAAGGEGSFVLLRGESGLGRRRLLETFAAEAASGGALVLQAPLLTATLHDSAQPSEWSAPFGLPLGLLENLPQGWERFSQAQRADIARGVQQALGAQSGVLSALLPLWRLLLPESVAPSRLPFDREPLRILNVLTEAVRALGRSGEAARPVVLCLGDLATVDADSLRWLSHLRSVLKRSPVLVVGYCDPAALRGPFAAATGLSGLREGRSLRLLDLPPLTREQCATYLAQRLGLPAADSGNQAPERSVTRLPTARQAPAEGSHAVAHDLAGFIHGVWGGRPLAWHLALSALAERGFLRGGVVNGGIIDSGGVADGVAHGVAHATTPLVDLERVRQAAWPESLRGLILHRLELLPDELHLVLEAAAVFPSPCAFEQVAAVLHALPLPELLERVEGCIAAGVLLRTPSGLRFAHPELQQAVYAQASSETRARHHLEAGSHLEATIEATVAATMEATTEATWQERGAADGAAAHSTGGREATASPAALQHHTQCALHFRAGGDTLRYLEHGWAAAQGAAEAQALSATAAAHGQLAPLLRGDPRAILLAFNGARAQVLLGRHEPAEALLQDLRAAPLGDSMALRVLHLSAWNALGARDMDGAWAWVEAGLERAGEHLPAHGMGTTLARLTGGAMRHYESARQRASGEALQPLTREEETRADLLALAGRLARCAPQADLAQAVLAEERRLRLTVSRYPSEHLAAALVRLGEAEAEPDAAPFKQAEQLLERHDLPHAQAELYLARGGCQIAVGALRSARDDLEAGRSRFAALGDAVGEAAALAALYQLERLRGPCAAVEAYAGSWLERASLALGTPAPAGEVERVQPNASAAVTVAAALTGRLSSRQAAVRLLASADALAGAGRPVEARAVLEEAAWLALHTRDAQALPELLRREAALTQDGEGQGAEDAPGWTVLRAEAHLLQAAVLPDAADTHLREVRWLLKRLRGDTAPGWWAGAHLGRLEALEHLAHGRIEAALETAAETGRALEAQGARMALTALWHAMAEGLKAESEYAGQDQGWLQWGGKALTLCNALGDAARASALRTLLELPSDPARPDSLAGGRAAAETLDEAGGPGDSGSSLRGERFSAPTQGFSSPHGGAPGGAFDEPPVFLALREQQSVHGALPEAELLSQILRALMQAVDAAYGAIYAPNEDGQLGLRCSLPTAGEAGPGAAEMLNGWVVEAVWQEARPRLLDTHRPADGSGVAAETHGMLAAPLRAGHTGTDHCGVGHTGAGHSVLGVAALGSPTGRTVFDRIHLERLEVLGRQAGLLLAGNRRLEAAASTRAGLERRLVEQRELMDWGRHGNLLDGPSALLAAYLDVMRLSGGSAFLYWLDERGEALELAAQHSVGQGGAAVPGTAALGAALARVSELGFSIGLEEAPHGAAALSGQHPVVIPVDGLPGASATERGLVDALGGSGNQTADAIRAETRALWLPLVRTGEAFGALLVVAPEVPSDLTSDEAEDWMQPLRLLLGALYRERREHRLQAEVDAQRTRADALEARGRTLEAFVPPGVARGSAGLDAALLHGVERNAPMLVGELPGLAQLQGAGAAGLMDALGLYFERVREALALHQGRLEIIGQPNWVARFDGAADSALWGAQTLHHMLAALRDERAHTALPVPPTGLGLHLGTALAGALPAGGYMAPFLVGAGVRTGSRLAALALNFRVPLLVSEDLVAALNEPDSFDLRPLGRLRPGAGESRVGCYELVSLREEGAAQHLRELLPLWQDALEAYQLSRWRKAGQGFTAFLERMPNDRPARHYLRHCRQRLAED